MIDYEPVSKLFEVICRLSYFFSPGYDEVIVNYIILYYFILNFGVGKNFFKLFLKDKLFLMKNTVL